MSGTSTEYRSVNFLSLCRLCITGTGVKINIFSPEGKKKRLCEKIKEFLSASVDENDDLPKIICNQCVDQIEGITLYRNSCLNAQIMLEGCISSGTIKSSGKVYIKEATKKETTTQTKSINTYCQNIQSQSNSKGPTMNTIRESSSPLEEFLKMKPNIKWSTVKKKGDVQYIMQKECKKPQVDPMHNEIRDKKINILLTPAINDQLYTHVENMQPIPTQILSNTNNPQNQVKQYITKLSPTNQVCTNGMNASISTKQCMLPITIKNEGSPDKQIIAHINTKNLMLPTYQLQMKFQPNTNAVDRQTVVQLTPTTVPVSIQSVGNNQNLNQFQLSNSSVPFYVTDCKQTNFENNDKNIQTQSYATSETITNNIPTKFPATTATTTTTNSTNQTTQPKTFSGIPSDIANVFLNKPGITINRVVNTHIQSPPISSTIIETSSNSQTDINSEVKEIGDSVLAPNSITTTTTATVSEYRCKVCLKPFKKKEHVTQHMKLHAGIRPFKCSENYCNKAFSRKEHLMRHMVSHTGKKLFHCDICQKYFSRKDNLNKHRRTHTDNSNNNGEFICETCHKSFIVKMYYVQHKLHCFKEISSNIKQNEA